MLWWKSFESGRYAVQKIGFWEGRDSPGNAAVCEREKEREDTRLLLSGLLSVQGGRWIREENAGRRVLAEDGWDILGNRTSGPGETGTPWDMYLYAEMPSILTPPCNLDWRLGAIVR